MPLWPTIILPADRSSATVAVAMQVDRAVMTPHALLAVLGGGARTVLWSSSTGTFNDATSLTPTYTPATIGGQEVTCTPSGPLGEGASDGEGWVVTRPVPAPSSTLGLQFDSAAGTYAPTLSDTASADDVTWLTTCTKVVDGTEVTVTNPTLTTPTFTIAVDVAYRVVHRATDKYGRSVDYIVVVRGVPSWHTVLDYDATAIATFGALATGSNVIGGLTWEVAVSTGSPTIDHTNGVGITVSVASATNTQALRANIFSLLAGPSTNIFRVSQVVDSISWSATNQYISLYVGSNAQPTSGSLRAPVIGARLFRTSSSDHRMRTVSNGTGTTIGGSNAISQSTGINIDAGTPTQAVFQNYCYGSQGAILITTGTTTIPAANVDPLGNVFEPNATYNRMSYMAAIADRTTAIDCWPAVYVGPHITGAGGTYSYVIKRILVEEWY